MAKYELLPEQLIREGICTEKDFFRPNCVPEEDILRVHTTSYYHRLLAGMLSPKEQRVIGFPWSPELVERELVIAQGTIEGSLYALQEGIAFNIAGGTHHAYPDRGEAFCMLNDQAIAAAYLLAHDKVQRILILDLDVHQGNGTAKIFENEKRVFTLSIHGQHNYPFRKERSDRDIALPDDTGDDQYLSALSETLRTLEAFTADFVFYLSGVDVLESDKLGRLSLSISGCARRDEMVFSWCKTHNIPLQCSMGGGYSPDLRTIVQAHANTFRTAQQIYC